MKITTMNLEGKKILIADQHIALGTELMRGMRKLGIYAERIFDHYNEPYPYGSPKDKLKNLFQINILGNKNYYQTLVAKHFDDYCMKSLEKFKDQKFDYIIVLRADKFSDKFLTTLKNIGSKMVSYNWDKIIPEKISVRQKFFDKVAVYNPEDMQKLDRLFLLHNYHFNDNTKTNQEPDFDLLYLGSAFNNEFREEKIQKLLETGIFKNPKIIFRAEKEAQENGFTKVSKDVPYDEYLALVKNSNVVADIKPSYQNGLSFRIFEALCYEKKLITNNQYVREFNFYDEDNIYITDYEDFTGLKEFVKKIYKPIDKEIVYEYSLENWLQKLLGDL